MLVCQKVSVSSDDLLPGIRRRLKFSNKGSVNMSGESDMTSFTSSLAFAIIGLLIVNTGLNGKCVTKCSCYSRLHATTNKSSSAGTIIGEEVRGLLAKRRTGNKPLHVMNCKNKWRKSVKMKRRVRIIAS